MIQFNELYTSLPEKDEHKKSKEYKKLSPKMKDAVDEIFAKMDAVSFKKLIQSPCRPGSFHRILNNRRKVERL